MVNIGLAVVYYIAAYATVTFIGILHTIFNIYVFHYKSMKESPGMGEAYEKTKPFHPLYNVIVFPLFAWFYFLSINDLNLETAIITGLFWGAITVVIDLVGWVIIKHPWSLSFKEFYLEYQPWITFIYVIIYLSPLITYGLMQVL